MSSGLVPYNFTFTDQSPIIRFYPYRDGPVDTQWNVSYSGSSFDDWSFDNNFGVGTSSHTTTFSGAYLIFEWTGTAVWLYGEAEPGTYSVSLDEALMFPNESTFNNVLFNQTDLQYGKHNLVFTIWENEATIYGATVTTGMGESGTVVQTKNISAVIDSSEQNPFFITDGDDWSTTVLYLNQSAADHYACITTSVLYAGLTFYVNESIAFEMYGSGDWTQGLYTVQVSPELPETDAQAYLPGPSIQYSPRSHWSDLDVPKFLATGLDRNHTYRVDVTNLGANFNLGSVVLYDAVPSASVTTSSTAAGTTSTSNVNASTTVRSSTTSAGATGSNSAGSDTSTSSANRSMGTSTLTGMIAGCVVSAFLMVLGSVC